MNGSPFPKFKQTIGDIRRFRTVVTVLFEEGFSFLVDEMHLRYLVPLRSRMKYSLKKGARTGVRAVGIRVREVPPEVRLRCVLERLGPAFMKLGQLLSVRPDIVPPEFVLELSKLQDRGPTLMPGVAEKIVEAELGISIENVFATFDEKPLAAASLAQVHCAELRDGTPVAVKVRRPRIEETVVNDIHILAYMAQLMEKHIRSSRRYRPMRVVREFADWTMRELDFEIEGAHIDMFRNSFVDMPEVVVPKVYWDYVGPSVLVTDLVQGLRVNDMKALDEAGVDKRKLARIGLRAGIRQFLIDGFFHADPHPGNLTVLPAEPPKKEGEEGVPLRLGLYDFGMIGRISDKHRFELIGCFVSFLERDLDGYIKHILDLSKKEEDADIKTFHSEARTILEGVLYKPIEKNSMSKSLYRVLISGANYGIIFPTDLVLLAKAFVTIENNVLQLFPDIDIEKEMRPFLAEVIKEEFSPRQVVANLKTSAFDSLYFMRHLPEQTQALFERLEKGEIGVKLNLQELRDLKEEFDRQNDVRVLALLAASLLIASAAVMRIDQKAVALGVSVGELGLIIALVAVVWLFVLIRRRP
ncbi:MAG: AarF/UbiB family protein [Patescibacteria group bacterium]|nr:AarF/UbiB family protein [Patescibacteria group bacterium]